MSENVFVLVPPSEGKAEGGAVTTKAGVFDALLASERKKVVGALRSALAKSSKAELGKTLKVRGELLDRALVSSKALCAGKPLLLPAHQRYTGVVWGHLDPTSLSGAQRKRLLVPSGLYGVTTGEDLVGDYRLKMDVALSPLGNVGQFWKEPLTTALMSKLRNKTVINLLPNEHEAAIDFDQLSTVATVVHVVFVSSDGSGAAGHDAKAVKGILARQLLVDGMSNIEKFSWQGWKIKRRGDGFVVSAPKAKKIVTVNK